MLTRQFAIFVAVGAFCALIDIGLMQLLIFAGINYIVAASSSFFLGLVTNFFFHAKLTFRTARSLPVLLRFLSVVAVNYALTLGFVAASFALVGNALPGKVLSLPVVAVNGFWLSRRWVFK